jgi:hypothetical protein
MSQTSQQGQEQVTGTSADSNEREVTVNVNNKPVVLPRRRETGLEIKEAAIAQGVEIELDFILTLEAHGDKPAETIDDDETITVTKHSDFIANDGDDDS